MQAFFQALGKYVILALPVIAALIAVNDWKVRVTIVIGFVSPIIIKYAPQSWKDHWMALTVFVVSFVAAGVLAYFQGSFKGFDANSAASVGITFVELYATQQYIFAAFKSALNLPDPGPPAPVLAGRG
jgi:hypothetical protein